jgi:CRISPR-associated protein Cmr4
MKTALLFMHALSPLHAGTGQGVGVIDLPIAREKATGLPYVPGSSTKGVLRDKCEALDAAQPEKKPASIAIFGPKTDNAEAHAGGAIFADQRLLLLPVRSLYGTFAWVTCPYVLHRFTRDLREVFPNVSLPPVPIPDVGGAGVAEEGSALAVANTIYLEDLDLMAMPGEQVTAWATALGKYIFADEAVWQSALTARLCIVPDDLFTFMLTTATEVVARIRLQEESKTVVDGGLWYEEALPSETVLSGLVLAQKVNGVAPETTLKAVGTLARGILQVGGKATVGRGLCRLALVTEG